MGGGLAALVVLALSVWIMLYAAPITLVLAYAFGIYALINTKNGNDQLRGKTLVVRTMLLHGIFAIPVLILWALFTH